MVLETVQEASLDDQTLTQIEEAIQDTQKTRPVSDVIKISSEKARKVEATLIDNVEKSPPGSVKQKLQIAIARLDFLGKAIDTDDYLIIEQNLIGIGCRTAAIYEQFSLSLQKYANGEIYAIPSLDNLFRETSSNKAVHTKERREFIEANCKYFRGLVGRNKKSAHLIALCAKEPVIHVDINGDDFADDRKIKRAHLLNAKQSGVISNEEYVRLQEIFGLKE